MLGRILIVLATLAVIAFVGVAWYQRPLSFGFYTDGESIRRPLDTGQPRDILWQPPKPPAGILPMTEHEYEPRLSRDGQTLYFVRGKADGNSDIFVSYRGYDGWSDAAPLTTINSPADDLGPQPSLDDQSLYFYSNREDGLGGFDIWVSRRSGDEWSAPVNLGPAVNSPFNDYGPAISPEGDELYFASNRPQDDDVTKVNPDAWPATIREEFHRRDYDLFTSSQTEQGFESAEPLIAVNTLYNEGAPVVSPFGDFLYFASDRPGGEGAYDLYRARLLHGVLQAAENLGDTINTSQNELDPALSMGGYELFFSSNRAVANSGPDQIQDRLPSVPSATEAPYHIYHSTSREVFVDTEVQRARIDWGSFFGAIGPNLLWLLLLLLLLLGLLALLKKSQEKEMSLLMRCLLASILAHLILFMILNLWGVTTALSDFLADKGVRVALSSPSVGNALASQIQGTMIEFNAPVPETSPSERQVREIETSSISAQPISTTVARTELPEENSFVHAQLRNAPVQHHQRSTASPAPVMSARPMDIDVMRETTAKAVSESDLFVSPQKLTTHRRTSNPRPVVSSQTATAVALRPARLEHRQKVSSSVADSAMSYTPQTHRSTRNANPPSASLTKSTTELADLGLPQPDRESQKVDTEPSLNASIPSAPARERSSVASFAEMRPEARAFQVRPESSRAQQVEESAIVEFGSVQPITKSVARQLNIPLSVVTHSKTSIELPGMEAGSASRQKGRDDELELTEPAAVAMHLERALSTKSMKRMLPTQMNRAVVLSPARIAETADTLDQQSSVTLRVPIATRPDSPYLAHAKTLTAPAMKQLALELSLPAEMAAPENPYEQRSEEDRTEFLERLGGSEDTEKAVAAALDWLARHQSPDGLWDGDGFDERCGQCEGTTEIAADIALTGLSVLCFLGADHHHEKDGPYRQHVDRALGWLVKQQGENGDLLGDETMYSHGIATIALSEAYGMTRDPRLKEPVRRAVRFIEEARNRRIGGWRYDPGQVGDTSVLGWQVMALQSARLAGIDVSEDVFEAAGGWMDLVSAKRAPGHYGYQPRRKPSVSMTAEGMFVQQLLGMPRKDERMIQSAKLVSRYLPDWDEQANTYYWYYATLAMYQHGGDDWQSWNDRLKSALLPNQERVGPSAGSWPIHGDWADRGGRIYQTALCTLMLEVYYRYLPLYNIAPKPPEPSPPDFTDELASGT
jgi:hypothetical protein